MCIDRGNTLSGHDWLCSNLQPCMRSWMFKGPFESSGFHKVERAGENGPPCFFGGSSIRVWQLRCQAGEQLERTGEALKIRRTTTTTTKAAPVCQDALAWRSTKKYEVLPRVFISASRGNGWERWGGHSRASGVACVVLTPLRELSPSNSTSALLSSNPRSAKKKKKKSLHKQQHKYLCR